MSNSLCQVVKKNRKSRRRSRGDIVSQHNYCMFLGLLSYYHNGPNILLKSTSKVPQNMCRIITKICNVREYRLFLTLLAATKNMLFYLKQYSSKVNPAIGV